MMEIQLVEMFLKKYGVDEASEVIAAWATDVTKAMG